MSCKVTVQVKGYDEYADTFLCHFDMPEVPCGGGEQILDSVTLACVVREWGEPSEFVGRTFSVEF
jgi:hypothetical protein